MKAGKTHILLPATLNTKCYTRNIYHKCSSYKLGSTCNHEEAGTRMVLHAAASEKLVINLWMYMVNDMARDICDGKVSKNKQNIEALVCRDICFLLQLHSITICDTLYFFGVRKVNTIRNFSKTCNRCS